LRRKTSSKNKTYHVANMRVACPDALFRNIKSPGGKFSTRDFLHTLQIERPQCSRCQEQLDKDSEEVVAGVHLASTIVLLTELGPSAAAAGTVIPFRVIRFVGHRLLCWRCLCCTSLSRDDVESKGYASLARARAAYST
jgi:hypothetical protein